MSELTRRGIALGITVMLLIATAAFSDVFLLGFSGFDYTEQGALGEDGSCYTAVGHIISHNPQFLNLNFASNEYTFVIANSYFESADTIGTNLIFYYDHDQATIDIYCDSQFIGTPAAFGQNPPNNTAPDTFEDGQRILAGDFNSSLLFVVDRNTMEGTVHASLDWVGGSQINNIPPSSRVMAMEFAGVAASSTHAGYLWFIEGFINIEEPTPQEPVSWGLVKSRWGR